MKLEALFQCFVCCELCVYLWSEDLFFLSTCDGDGLVTMVTARFDLLLSDPSEAC